ncbi:MAG: hypothetical protein AB1591_02740 [Pseudomonadota bacterium]
MLAIWRMVREEMALRGARSVRQACRQIMERAGAVKFKDSSKPGAPLFDDIHDEGTLRQRYLVADKLRSDKARFPVLHLRALQFEQDLPKIAAGLAHLGAVYADMARDGEHRCGLYLKHDEKFRLAFQSLYTKRKRR